MDRTPHTPASPAPRPPAPPPLRTARLDLMPLAVHHADEMRAVLADPALHAFIGGTPPTADELRARYARQSAGSPDPDVLWANWVIRLRTGREDGERGAGHGHGHGGDDYSDGDGSAAGRGGGAGPLIGTVQSTVSPAEGGASEAELAWVVGTPWQGRGFATEAARALAGWATSLPVSTLVAHIAPDHHASAAVAAACGLAPTGLVHDGEIRWEHRTTA
ncbi:GNAT family N-acetyltransferase [uncultured Streptomyces sp.]|uniref:GNAT family N-acetyltransferase n=1 Tax=uncultured Streptomyces sp. TaxID=174707 RepID=UPI00262CDB80|nr:GNAT family N-acetyltransferase [uncultured Streptomyces sp.]